MIRCLTRRELAQIVGYFTRGDYPAETDLRAWLDSSLAWQDELVGFNYFLAQILLQLKRDGVDYGATLSEYFSIGDRMWFSVEEFDARFIDFMLNRLARSWES